jgi:hypothetical protein
MLVLAAGVGGRAARYRRRPSIVRRDCGDLGTKKELAVMSGLAAAACNVEGRRQKAANKILRGGYAAAGKTRFRLSEVDAGGD